MYVLVDLALHPPVLTLEEPEDTQRFHVTVRGGTGPVDEALVFAAFVDAAAGRLEGEDAWITVDAIRRLAVGRVGADWDDRLDAMLDYARGRGWLDETSHAVRAHVEWTP